MSDRSVSVLIVDDDVAVRESFSDYFEDHGWQVWAVGTAEEGLALLDRVMPDAAIVDIRLPGMDGNSFLRVVSERHPSLPCIVCTGSPDYDLPEDLTVSRVGERRVFAKPVPNLGDLVEEVHRQLGIRSDAPGSGNFGAEVLDGS